MRKLIDAINAMPKYVASSSLTDVGWNATVLSGDVVSEPKDTSPAT